MQGIYARFEPPEKLHITLAFLGYVEPERIEEIGKALHAIARGRPEFELHLDKVGAFPHERRPRVIWIGSRDQGAEFRDLARASRDAYAELGFSFDKNAIAHVTIARVKEGHAHLSILEIEPIRVPVKAITLFESIPDGRTTRYEVRDRAPMR
jgi:2'-5' RNA ligase